MRQLTAKQKKLLKETLDNDKEGKIYDVDSLPYGIWQRLEELNDTEILWQEANRYIGDYCIKRNFGIS